jgi:uncharacterized protein
MTPEERRRFSTQRNLEKSEQALKSALLLLDHDDELAALNRMYYAIFYVLSVFVLHNSFSTANHKQLLGWFNKTFINGGMIDKSHSKVIFQAFDYRSEADYADIIEINRAEIEEHFT